ncbi:uncharacterized protein C2orf42 homolog [Pleurodeles waltl]
MDASAEKAKAAAFLSDLGKATLRGIRKCPQCGTFNGTRGLSCKNKSCGAVFRCGVQKAPNMDAVRVITGSEMQVFSVRLKDKGPDYRCFVELGITETAIETADGMFITQLQSSHCYAPACLKVASQGIEDNNCQHIKLALNCQREATPLTLKSSVLNAMQVPAETKSVIWQLATEPTGPLVQRITKSIMVVKCKITPKHSLGYLHVSFVRKPRSQFVPEHRFLCTCQMGPKSSGKVTTSVEEAADRCIHFYACISAFASDEALSQEFSTFLRFENNSAQVDSPMLTQETVNNVKKSTPKKPAVAPTLKRQMCIQAMDESQVLLTFQDWLASVTERIHQTLHYQFDGKPDPLVFHIPQCFFDALQQRISIGSTKKRLPDSTTAFIRKDALPLGTFNKYTWHITSVLEVKQIFDTAEMPLEITRSFVQNSDGTYELFKCPKVEVESIAESYGRADKQPIRPLELKTFLKVGAMSSDQKEPTPFIIEWIPDILPESKIGELRIKFEYGHHRNGQSADYLELVPPLEQSLELTPLTTITFP